MASIGIEVRMVGAADVKAAPVRLINVSVVLRGVGGSGPNDSRRLPQAKAE